MRKIKKGFTLIEIMLVVIIIGVLVAMVAPNISGRSEQARAVAARTDIEANLSTALDLFQMDIGHYPTTAQGLQSLVTAPTDGDADKWKGPYLKKKHKIPKDPWNHEYVYKAPGEHNKESYDLSSLGADGTVSADDVANWDTGKP
ncbi:MAG: type II secretion system major pseudopilin GspG [Candidatus Omnitrophica bacterium]|nr:type II secretion system major pseudopilin GspG [Candidatus Omnitrophota bacterium]